MYQYLFTFLLIFLQVWKNSFCNVANVRPFASCFFFLLFNFFLRFQNFCCNYGRLLENSLKICRNLILQNLACLILFESNKVEATTRCPTECVLKTFANTL